MLYAFRETNGKKDLEMQASLKGATVEPSQEGDNAVVITLNADGRPCVIAVSAPSAEVQQQWLAAIGEEIANA